MKKRLIILCLILIFILAAASCNDSSKLSSSGDEVKMERDFMVEDFKNPGNKYRPMPIIHVPVDQAYIGRLEEWGYGGLVTNVSFDAYLQSEEGWDIFVDTTERLMDAGLRMWIYDERQYPSGAAGGLVLKENPEWEAQALVSVIEQAGEGNTITVEKPYGHNNPIFATAYKGNSVYDMDISTAKDLLSEVDNNGDLTWTTPDDDWFVIALYSKPFYEGTHATNNWAEYRRYINLLEPEPIQAFINLTHKEYYERVGQYFGNGIEAFFTDEPALLGTYFTSGPPTQPALIDPIDRDIPLIPAVNWSDSLHEVFKEQHGYDMQPYLPYLFEGNNEEARRFRWDFYRTTSSLVADNYMGQIGEYLEDKGVASSGHLLLEEDIFMHPVFNGNIMQIYAKMQYPGIDLLTSHPKRAIDLATTVAKFASSSAHFHGRDRVMSEVSDAFDTTKGDIYGRVGAVAVQYAMGVNQITSFYPPTDMSKEENRIFTDTIGRMGYMLDGGIQDSNVLLYYPIEGIWVDTLPPENLGSFDHRAVATSNEYTKINRELTGRQIDYSIIDSIDLQSCEVRDSRIYTPGGQSFSVFVLPQTPAIEKETLEFLRMAEENGVKIVVQEAQATIVYGEDDSSSFDEFLSLENVTVERGYQNAVSVVEKLGVKTIIVDGADENVVITKKVYSDKCVYMIVNASDDNENFTVTLNETGNVIKLWDPYSGEVRELENQASEADSFSKMDVKVQTNRTVFITVES